MENLLPRSRIWINLLFLFFLLNNTETVSAQFNKAYFFYRGEELISKGNYAEAIPVLNTLLNADSTIHEAWFLRGAARYHQGDLVGAQSDFNKCLRLNPLFSQAHQYNAMAYEQLGKSNDAIESIKKAIELRPNSAQYLFTYGVILFQQEHYNEALLAFNRVIRIDERIPDAWLNRGTTRLMLSDSTGALNDYTTAINLSPFNANPYLRRGSLFAQQKNYEMALGDLNQAILLDSSLVQAYFTRALVYYYQKQPSLALADLDKVLQMDSRHTLGLFNRAIISYENGLPEAAIDDLTRLSSIIPSNVLVHYYLASIRFERGYLSTALENINKAIELFPQFANAYLLRAEIKTKKDDLKGAEADLEKGKMLANEYHSRSVNDINSFMDSTGKLKRLLSLNEELDITSTISMEQLRNRIITIVYPLITLKIDDSQKVKPKNWQSSSIRRALEAISCNGYTLYFDYDSNSYHQQSMKPIETDSLNNICLAVHYLEHNQYTSAESLFNEIRADKSTDNLIRLTEILARVKMAQFIESVKNKNKQSENAKVKQEQDVNETFIVAANDLKNISLLDGFEGIVPYNIGVIYMQTEKNDEAMIWFTRAIEQNQLLDGAWYNRGLLYLISNETAKGCTDLRRAVDLGNAPASEVVARFCKK